MGLIKYPWLLKKHFLNPYALRLFSLFSSLHVYSWRSFSWKGLDFPNPLGLAAGVDKNAQNILDWWKFGAGFLEIGTVTPQKTYSHSSLLHSNSHYALWNSLDFPSLGVEKVKKNLKRYARPYHTPIFLNLGKNAPLEKACEDYKVLIRQLVDHADAFVININSSNITDLHFKDFLGPILDTIKAQEYVRPTLLKLSPDGPDELFLSHIGISKELGIDGWVLTNTTKQRPISFPKHGGLSGHPLKKYSEHRLNLTVNYLGKQKKDYLIVSVGGVMTPKDVEDRLNKGANLVQVYTALFFNGPWFFKTVSRSVCI